MGGAQVGLNMRVLKSSSARADQFLNPCYSAGYEHTHMSVSNSRLGSLRVEENGVMPCAFTQTQP